MKKAVKIPHSHIVSTKPECSEENVLLFLSSYLIFVPNRLAIFEIPKTSSLHTSPPQILWTPWSKPLVASHVPCRANPKIHASKKRRKVFHVDGNGGCRITWDGNQKIW